MLPYLRDQESVSAFEQARYIDDLWFLLHHSEEGDRLVFVLGLTCYLDDSGSDNESPLVTCGGLLMTRIQFKAFSGRWAKMYQRDQFSGYSLKPPLHMKDFTGMGKYAGLPVEFKRAIFRDVAKLINDHKLYSISVAVSQIDFARELTEDVRKTLIGPYAFAFLALLGAHQFLSSQQRLGPIKTAYLVDHGFGHHEQLAQAHKLIVDFEVALRGPRHTGAMATDSDDGVPPLQAADVISWASRKMELSKALPVGFEPLGTILLEEPPPRHRTLTIPRDGIRMLANPVNKWISEHGSVPQLADIVQYFNGIPVKLKT
jgi:hypothetical protein